MPDRKPDELAEDRRERVTGDGLAHSVPFGFESPEAAALPAGFVALLLAEADAGFAFLDRSACIRYAGARFWEILRLRVADAVGRPLAEIAGEPYRSLWAPFIAGALAGSVQRNVRSVLPGVQTVETPLSCTASFLPVRAGSLIEGVAIVVRVGPDPLEADAALRQSEARYRHLAESVPHLVWAVDAEGAVTYANERWSAYTGCAADEMLAAGWEQFVAPEDRGALAHAWASARETGLPFGFEVRLRRADGEYRWFLLRAVPLPNGKAGHGAWLGTCTDVHERRIAAEQQRFLVELDAQMRSVRTPDEIIACVLNSLGKYLHASRCLYAEFDRVGDDVMVIVHQDFHEADVASNVGVYSGNAFGEQIVTELRQGKSVAVTDVTRDPRTLAEAAYYTDVLHSRSFTTSSLNRNGFEAAALTAVDAASPRAWREDEVDLVRVVLERTWLALEAARFYREAQRAEQARSAFARDVLASVTDGCLQVCSTAGELPQPLPQEGPRIDLTRNAGARELRHLAVAVAEALGFARPRLDDLATAVGEGAMNAIVHARNGRGWVCTDGRDAVQVWIVDEGAGISLEDLPRATLARGYSTRSSLGHGFKLMIGTVDRVYLVTGAGGTTVVLEQGRHQPLPAF